MMQPLRFLTFAFLLLTAVSPIQASDIQLVSHSERAVFAWDRADLGDSLSNFSADGRFAVFGTRSPINGLDINAQNDVVLLDRTTGELTLVSHTAAESKQTGDEGSTGPSISADGNWVFFLSRASDLVSGYMGPANRNQLYAWERATGNTRLVSHATGSPTTGGNDNVTDSVLVSASGDVAVFASRATDYTAGTDVNGTEDIFRWSRATGTIELVSRSAASPTTTANGFSGRPSLSADGQRVAFESRGTDLVADGTDGNGRSDVFLWDEATGMVTLVSESMAGGGATANGDSFDATISADGTVVVFTSVATDLLVASDPIPFSTDVFRWVASSGTVELVSHRVGDSGTAANGISGNAVVSSDGQTVVFSSRATDLVSASDVASDDDVFRWSATTGTAELLSTPDGGATASLGNCFGARIDDDAGLVVFECTSSDLVPGTDNNGSGRDVFLWQALDGMVRLVSRKDSDPSSTGESSSQSGQPNADGSVVLFESSAGDLVDVAQDGVYVLEVATNTLEVVSRPPAVSTDLLISPGGDVRTPVVSGDGRWVVFQSSDPFFMDGVVTDSNNQLFLYDRVQGIFTLVSRSAADALIGASRDSSDPQISEDGSAVVFVSTAPDLVSGVTNASRGQIYHWDRQSGTVRLVSHAPGDVLEGGTSSSTDPVVSADGNTVYFVSGATNLPPGGDGNFSDDVFMWDATTGAVRVVSRSAADATVTGNAGSNTVSMSSDGRYAAFRSAASDLITGFVNPGLFSNIFLWDRTTGDVELVTASIVDPVQGGDGDSIRAQVSADGSAVVFISVAGDLLAGLVSNGGEHVYHWHRASDDIQLVSRAAGTTTTASNSEARNPVLSGDGDVVVFDGRASDLVPGQVDAGFVDTFVWVRSTGDIELASRSTAGATTTGNGNSSIPSISRDGARIVFESEATDLMPGFSGSGEDNLFLYDRSTGTVRLVNRSIDDPNMAPPQGGAGNQDISADGRWITFLSRDPALTQGLDEDDSVDVYLASLDEPTNADLQLTLSTPVVLPLPPSAPFSLDVRIDNLSASSATHLYAALELPEGVDFLGFSGAGWTCDVYLKTISCGGELLPGGSSDTLTLDLQGPAVAGPFGIGGSTIWPGVDPDLGNNLTLFEGAVATDDWGDAPDPSYPTLAASNGARHGLSGLFLGSVFDVDEDGQPTATADGDDTDGSDDDDGISLPSVLIQGQADSMVAVASAAGLLDAWMDWNADGDWSDAGEQIAAGVVVAAGVHVLPLTVPVDAALGDTFARFRLSSTGVASPTGAAVDGEVEDYLVSVEARADLTVEKGASPDPVIAGEILAYALTVTNLGPSPSTGSVVSDVLPVGVTFLSSADGCAEAGGTVTCSIAPLASAGNQTVSFQVTVDPSQTDPLVNTAAVVGNETDPVPGNNTSPAVTTTVMAESDLVVTVTDGRTQANSGDSVTYTVTVAKSGPSDAPGTQVQDVFPAALVNVTWTCTPSAGSTCSAAGSGDIDDVADLAAGGSVAYEATGTLDDVFVGSLENTAIVTSAVGVDDPNTANNTATDVTEVTSPADVSGTLEVLAPASLGEPSQGFQPGDTVTYLAVLVNASPTAQLNNPGAEFSDTLPVGLSLSNAAADSGVVTLDPSTGTVTWDGVIPGGGAVAITLDAVVEYGTHGRTLVNQGTVFFDADGDGTNESSAVTDDPNQGGAGDGTAIVILELVEVPTLGSVGLALLVLVLGAAGVRRLRRE